MGIGRAVVVGVMDAGWFGEGVVAVVEEGCCDCRVGCVRSMVVEVGATLMKQTSGGSISHTLSACSLTIRLDMGWHTYRILPIKDKTQSVDLVLVDGVVV
jgi:hypothetical protein